MTVVIPCSGRRRTLGRALASLRDQTAPPEETLVVDDGSDPAAAAEMGRTAAEFAARVLRLPQNAGPAAARNAGWDAARSAYVAFLDDDDALHPRKLELQAAVMAANPGVALTGTGFSLFPSGVPRWEEPPDPLPLRTYPLLASLIVSPSRTSTWMVRQSLPRRFPPHRRHVEDFLFLLEMLLDGEETRHLDAPLTAIFEDPLTGSGLTAQLLPMERAELRMYSDLRSSGRIGAAGALALQGISLLKFTRRLLLRATMRFRR